MSTLSAKILKDALDNCKLTLEDLRNFLPNTKKSQEAFKAFSKWNIISDVPHLSENRDFRFCHLLLKNFRKFGDLAGNTYYGLKFIDKSNDKDVKLIDFLTLLGDNGIGKSSLVNSLEYMFTGNIGEAQIRQIPENQYIRNKSGEKTVKLYTNNGMEFVLDDNSCKSFRQEYDVSNFFFSENSILKFAEYTQRNREDANDWFPFFCHILGLGALFDACANEGILAQIKAEIEKTKSLISSESISQIRKKIQNLLRDGSLKIGEQQRQSITRMLSKLSSIKQDIRDNKICSIKEIPILTNKDFHYKNNFYFINEFYDFYQKIVGQKAEPPQSNFGTKKILNDDKETEVDHLQRFSDSIDDCITHIQNVLRYGTGIVPIDDIKNEMLLLIKKEQSNIVGEHHHTTEELNQLLEKIEQFKATIQQLMYQTVTRYVDNSLVETVTEMFDKTFITEDEKNLKFDISKLVEEKKIFISIKEEPVHKYFNTFRYRLFCLTLQATLNIKLMMNEDFSFPLIIDDVFYANDYRNKRELFRYFEQIREYAKNTLKNEKALQIIFFTHDEQIVSCFSTRFKNDRFVRLIQPAFAEKIKSHENNTKENKEKYHNLYFTLYD